MAIQDPGQSGLGVIKMAGQHRGALLQFLSGEQLIELAMDGNEHARIIVAAVHKHHSHAQLPDGFLIERLQPVISEEANKKTMEVKVVIDGINTVLGTN